MNKLKNITLKTITAILRLMPIPARKFIVQVIQPAPNEILKGRTAFITGGTSGIGINIAKSFLNSGATVIITGRNIKRIQNAIEKLDVENAYKDRLFGIELDNTQIESFEDKFKEALNIVAKVNGGVIDILVNNAGVMGASFPDATLEQYNNVLDTNLKGVFFLSQMFGKYFKKNKIEGNILNIASSSSLRPASCAYTLSKWGIRGLTLGLAKSLSPYGITVNGIAPGPTVTPMLIKNNSKDISLPSKPIGRYALPEEIANMAVVLVSPMGRTIVGDIVYMTGGAGLLTFDDVPYTF